MHRDALAERVWAFASRELDADPMVDPVYDLDARADALPLSPSSSHAMSHEGRCREA
jgi:hypothetical protein